MFAFLFDEDHPDLQESPFVGPPCTSRVVQFIEPRIENPVQILRGAIVAHTHAYRTAEIALGTKVDPGGSGISATSDRISRTADMRIQAVLIGELYETLFNASRTVDQDRLLKGLIKCTVWVVSVVPLSVSLAEELHSNLTDFGPYLGYSEIDLQNPFLFDTFVSSMFHDDLLIDGNGIYIRDNPYEDQEDKDDSIEMAKSHGSSFIPKAIDHSSFEQMKPDISATDIISERGLISIRRIGKVSKPTQREILARDIYKKFSEDKLNEPLRFVAIDPADKPPVYVAEDKIKKYLLNLNHADGGPKAQFFRDILGIVEADWAYLQDQILRGWKVATLYRVGRNAWSYTHGALMSVVGRNGREVVLETGWKVSDDGPVEFVTAYPADEKQQAQAAKALVVLPSLQGSERWEQIYTLAQSEASKAHDDAIPTPMFLSGYLPEWDGKCGWTYVHVPSLSARDFVRWLTENQLGVPEKGGARLTFQSQTQSIDRSTAAAEAFSEVLAANGILSTVEPVLD